MPIENLSCAHPSGRSGGGSHDTDSLDKRLVEASEQGNIEQVEDLLLCGAKVSYLIASANDLNINDIVYRSSAISAAARSGHFEIAVMLLNYEGLSSERLGKEKNPYYWSILAETLRTRSKNTDEPLLNDDGEILELSDEHYHDQVWLLSNIDVMRYLIHAGADVDRKFQNGFTPLMMAVSEGLEDVTRFLLAAGADPNISTTNHLTALILASRCPSVDILCLLLENGANPNSQDPDSKDEMISYPLFWAISSGSRQHVGLLMHHGAVPNPVPEYALYTWHLVPLTNLMSIDRRLSPLHMALYHNRLDIAQFFCDVGFLVTSDVMRLGHNSSVWDILESDEDSDYSSSVEWLQAFSSSLPLVTLTFVSISNKIGFGADREEKLLSLKLPPTMRKMFMFQASAFYME